MDEKRIAIRISGVKKRYRLGAIGGKTLQEDLQSWWAKKRGREDPNLRIGTDTNKIGQFFWALDDINLTIYKGERVGIIGINGAGKSTLLKILSRITAPTEGEIDIYGRISSMLEVGTGFHRELTGRENIYMNGAILGMSRQEIDRKVDDIIAFSEIGEFIDTPAKRYSSGMYVKLAFAVAAHLDSEILVMDEVLAVGDMAFQKKCLDRMNKLAEDEGRTVLYVSHNMNTIRQLCDRVIVLDHGKVIFDGNTESGIAVYMNHCVEENGVDMDLRGKDVDSHREQNPLHMEHLCLKGKAVPVYSREEDLLLAITLETAEPMQNIRFRLTLRTDGDVALGTAWSEAMSFPTPGHYTVDCSMPLSTFEKGTFYGSIGFYRVDAAGRSVSLEHITRAFRMEIPGPAERNISAYGYMQLPVLTASVSSTEA